jgi:hypothetical protein
VQAHPIGVGEGDERAARGGERTPPALRQRLQRGHREKRNPQEKASVHVGPREQSDHEHGRSRPREARAESEARREEGEHHRDRCWSRLIKAAMEDEQGAERGQQPERRAPAFSGRPHDAHGRARDERRRGERAEERGARRGEPARVERTEQPLVHQPGMRRLDEGKDVLGRNSPVPEDLPSRRR